MNTASINGEKIVYLFKTINRINIILNLQL